MSKYKSYLVRLRATSSHPADAAWRQSASSAGQTLGAPRDVSVGNSTLTGSNQVYPVSWKKPANTDAAETFAYQVQCTDQNNKTTTNWNGCGTVSVSATANTSLNANVQHNWLAGTFYYIRIRTVKDGVNSDWVIKDTEHGSP